MKKELGKRSLALLLSLLLVVTMTPAKMVIAEGADNLENKITLTVDKNGLSNCSVSAVKVAEGENEPTVVSSDANDENTYQVTADTKLTVTVTVSANTGYDLKTTPMDGWTVSGSDFTYTYESGISQNTSLILQDTLFVQEKVESGTDIGMIVGNHGKVLCDGQEISGSINVKTNKTFVAVPNVGYYVSTVKVSDVELAFATNNINAGGSYNIPYAYTEGKSNDTIEVSFAPVTTKPVEELSVFGVDSSKYYKEDTSFYTKDALTLTNARVTISATGNGATSYDFKPSQSIGTSFEGTFYTFDQGAGSYAAMISGYTLTLKQDNEAPTIKDAKGSSWTTDQKVWIGGNQTGDTVEVGGKIQDDGTGVKSVKYMLSVGEPSDWTQATEISLQQDGTFSLAIEKNILLSQTEAKCYIQALDFLGNERVVHCAFAKDETAPKLEITVNEKHGSLIFSKGTVKVSVKAKDEAGDNETDISGINADTFKVYVDNVEQVIDGDAVKKEGSGNTYTITIKDVGRADHEITAEVVDNAGNRTSTGDNKTHIRYDEEKPEVANVTAAENSKLTQKADTFYYKNTDQLSVDVGLTDNIGMRSYEIETKTSGVTLSDTNYPDNNTGKITHTFVDASEDIVYHTDERVKLNFNVSDENVSVITCTVKVIDLAGNESEIRTLTFEKDDVAPQFTTDEASILKKSGQTATLTGDKYYIDASNKPVTVSTIVKDDKSGVAKIQLLNNTEVCAVFPSENATYDSKTGKVTFKNVALNDGDNWFTVVAMDLQGNTTESPVGLYTDNKAVTYDSSLPTIIATITGDQSTTTIANPNADPTFYYQNSRDLDNANLKIVGQDNEGLVSLVVKTGETEHPVDITKQSAKQWEVELTGSTIYGWLNQSDGDVAIIATDLSGNTSAVKTIHFVQDKAGAEINNVQVAGTTIDAKGADNTYQYFFHAGSVTMTADIIDALSGVRSITYTVADENGTTRSGAGASVAIAAPFKGMVTYTVYDKVNNKSVYQTKGIVVTNGTTGNAVMTTNSTGVSDATGNPLYGKDTSVAVDVVNTYAGIESISYAVIAPYNTENNTEATIFPGTEGWETARDANGMATKMTGSIPVTNNSNNITVSVTIRDKAGIEQTFSRTISIDKTAPSISVSYDNNNVDSGNRYRADRTATIIVRERNFNENDFRLNITNSAGNAPSLSGWTEYLDTKNPDNSAHVATLTFASDGDYVMDMSYADVASNAGNLVATQSFTVDKTAPSISVTFDNNSASNDHYFAQSRTVTITVNEHYFDASRVTVSGTATNDGTAIAFPGISGWTDNGDQHTATINFTADGDYQFTVNAQDQAGNAAPEYAVAEFVVDQTAPTITFGGVEDQASYNDVVEPTVTFEDVNYDSNNVNITLVGANQGQVNYGSGAGDSNNGQTITYSDFEHTAEVDDIYTLTATITDMAGNNFEDSITFSVNRFGSNYELDDSLKEIQGKYIKEPIDVVFTETNVNTLTEGSSKIVVSTNGTPKTLTAGSDYQVANAGGGGSWSRYTYTIPKDVFDADGTYIVSVYSEDTAGNVNENDAEGKDAEITFGVDGTAPVISMTNLEENGNYNATNYDATVNVSDNLVLEDVSIELNGEKVETKVSNDNYTFSIPESTDKQTVTVVATDAAGNSLTQEVSGIVVTTNAFVRFLNNTKALVGTIVGVVAVGGFTAFIVINGGIGSLRFRPKKEKKSK